MKQVLLTLAAAAIGGTVAAAQAQPPQSAPASPPVEMARQVKPEASKPRPASPRGSAQTETGGEYTKDEKGRTSYRGGKWIEITYGRPIKRGRDVFGSGADYGKSLYAGAPLWRAGADQSTRLSTELPLVINGKPIPAGEYSLFIELKSPTEWTLVVSSYGAKTSGGDKTPDTLWGAYNYTPDKDVVRAPMMVQQTDTSVDQLTWLFADVTNDGGKLVIAWDRTMASVPFTVGK